LRIQGLAEHEAMPVRAPQPHLTTPPRLISWRFEDLGALGENSSVEVVDRIDVQVGNIAVVTERVRGRCIWTPPKHERHRSGVAEDPVPRVGIAAVAPKYFREPRGRPLEIMDGENGIRASYLHQASLAQPGVNQILVLVIAVAPTACRGAVRRAVGSTDTRILERCLCIAQQRNFGALAAAVPWRG
jgi:hypothetical protein